MKMKRLAGLTSLVMIASMLGTAAIAAVEMRNPCGIECLLESRHRFIG